MPATYDAVQSYMSIFDMWRLAMWHMAAAYDSEVEDARPTHTLRLQPARPGARRARTP